MNGRETDGQESPPEWVQFTEWLNKEEVKMIKTQGVVHFSLPVTDLERSARFYSALLGMKVMQKTPRMVFLKCGED
jgi:catechol-2,3-dioxygenase